jgi:hypothetical protein
MNAPTASNVVPDEKASPAPLPDGAGPLTKEGHRLYNEYRHDYHFAGFDRERFKRQCRALAKRVSRKATHETAPDEAYALLYLDVITLRAGFVINSWRE